MSVRFTPEAAETMRNAIAEAHGVEVFAIGKVGHDRCVSELEIHCRGTADSVPALLQRPKPGEVVIHNHPSGVLEPSGADMALANLYGEDGVGVIIVDNKVRRDRWVVEPMVRPLVRLDLAEVMHFFEEKLPAVIPQYESRPGQIAMALRVAEALNDGQVALFEAGTGTGKSLAYLVPAAMWAVQNQGRVAIATYTIALQGQLANSDLKLMERAGLEFRSAVLMGRNNYLCKRKLELALSDATGANAAAIQSLDRWARTSAMGARGDLNFPVDEHSWDQVQSDSDQTLAVRCPHYANCFYYNARRAAADAHVLVVNHHLLLADMAAKHASGGTGVLPRYDRAVVDEGHHLEDAATLLYQGQLGVNSLRRSVRGVLSKGKRKGALAQIQRQHFSSFGHLHPDDVEMGTEHIDNIALATDTLLANAPMWMEAMAEAAGLADESQVRITPEFRAKQAWLDQINPTLDAIKRSMLKVLKPIDGLFDVLDSLPDDARLGNPQPIFDLRRARRRLKQHLELCSGLGAHDPDWVGWLERDRRYKEATAARLCSAPIQVGSMLRAQLFETLQATIVTSATLTVGQRFEHVANRIGLKDCERMQTANFPSPFDFSRQAILGIPRDVPSPKEAHFVSAAAQVVVEAIRLSDGGVFVLCTSFAMLNQLHAAATIALGDSFPLLKQRQMGRERLLSLYRADRRSVLFGTDSFWEGIDVKGDQLRMIIIPRLPFRVPTEPVQQARHEALQAQGLDPFRAYSLPQAVLRFRQGFGRLIRTCTDTGAVLVLDRRITSSWYGRVFMNSLPDVPRAQGPTRAVLERVRHLVRSD
jgi:ATP-dependent DNA helicase DinG